jgi:hypothetical protein
MRGSWPITIFGIVPLFVSVLMGCRSVPPQRDPLQRQSHPVVAPATVGEASRSLECAVPDTVRVSPMVMAKVPRPVPPPPPPMGGSQPIPIPPPIEKSPTVASVEVAPVAAIVPANPRTEPKPAPQVSQRAAAQAQLERAQERWNQVRDYTALFTRREVVKSRRMPEEVAEFRLRQQPKSVALRTVSSPGLGREVCWVDGRDGNSFHVLTGEGDNRIVGAGFKTTLRMDSTQATSKSRYTLQESGFGRAIAGFRDALQWVDAGQAELRVVSGAGNSFEIRVPASVDPTLPTGGRRRFQFESAVNHPAVELPTVVQAWDASGQEVEFYHFQQVQVNVGLSDAVFDPRKMGAK